MAVETNFDPNIVTPPGKPGGLGRLLVSRV